MKIIEVLDRFTAKHGYMFIVIIKVRGNCGTVYEGELLKIPYYVLQYEYHTMELVESELFIEIN